jgi:hypothetical protein
VLLITIEWRQALLFIVPANPGIYPAGNIPAAQCGQWEAEHKELIQQFQM